MNRIRNSKLYSKRQIYLASGAINSKDQVANFKKK